MINKCKVQIRKRELYNVVKSLKREEGEKCILTEEIESAVKYPSLCSCSCNNIVHVSDRAGSLRLSSLTHPLQSICCGLRLGPRPDKKGLGQKNRATTNTFGYFILIDFLKSNPKKKG